MAAENRPVPFTNDEITRYSRHLLMPEVGREGQARLKAARVLCVGAGGLGSPIATYLAAAGVGTIGLVDFDTVDLTNLQRQVLYATGDLGRPKLAAARDRLAGLNPGIEIALHDGQLTSRNALEVVGRYDLVVDGTDNFPARYLINDACVLSGKPYVYGSVFRFEGQASVFATPEGPCYRCLYPEPPPPGIVPSCAEAGVLGALPGIIGTIQATEALKWILGAGEPLVGRILILDGLRMRFREVRLKRDADCPVCGLHPTIRTLIDYERFCGVQPVGPPAGGLAPHDMTVEDLKARLDRGDDLLLVDVREPLERDINGLPGALAIRVAEIGEKLKALPRDRDLVLFCRVGERSARAVADLRAAGFTRAWNLAGGMLAWVARIDPSQPRY